MTQKIILTAIAIIVLALGYITLTDKPKDAYVNLTEVYQKFNHGQTLNKQLQSYLDLKYNELDSLTNDFQQYVQNHQDEEMIINNKYQALTSYKQETQKQIENMELMTENKIWELINKTVNTYGKTHELDFIYGASGSGTLMYANDKHNISGKIIDLLNQESYVE